MSHRPAFLLAVLLFCARPALAQGAASPLGTRWILGLERGQLLHASGRRIPSRDGTIVQAGWRVDPRLDLIAHGTRYEAPAATPAERMTHWGVSARAQASPMFGLIAPFVEAGVTWHRRDQRDSTRAHGSGILVGAGAAIQIRPSVGLHASTQFHDAYWRRSLGLVQNGEGTSFRGLERGKMRNYVLKAGIVWRP